MSMRTWGYRVARLEGWKPNEDRIRITQGLGVLIGLGPRGPSGMPIYIKWVGAHRLG